MKIALISIHWVNNYGAALQVFATAKALEKYGTVAVLDYRNEFVTKDMHWIRFEGGLKGPLRTIKDLLRAVPRYRCLQKFEDFYVNALHLTQTLKTDADFQWALNEFDVFCSGSDQIWNPYIVNAASELDRRYFLDFVTDKPKISYASSSGSYQYDAQEKPQVIELLADYADISVREKDAAEYFASFMNRPVDNVLDPTLLHNKTQWLEFFDIKPKPTAQPYILVYALKKDSLLQQVIKAVQAKLNLRVIALDQDPYLNYKADEHIKDGGPKEFIELYANASFVVTNSFHGTCFAINFTIPFVSTTPQSSTNRVLNILKAVGAEDRLVQSIDAYHDHANEPLDFAPINEKLGVLRAHSLQYLANAFAKIATNKANS